MRVMLGELKGRPVSIPNGIRPASNIVKKACFDILKGEIEGKRVLDLFSGSGALGIESLSLGAKEAVFIDSNPACVSTIKKNLFSLGLDQKASVYFKDALSAINDFYVYKKKFDLIFLDPPYYEGHLINTLQNLEDYDILTPSGYIISLSYIKDKTISNNKHFSVILEKKYGQTRLFLYVKKEI